VTAAASTAATLTVTVKPTEVKPGQTYSITITGRYDKRRLHTTPYLLAFLQYSPAACKPTATAEYALPGAEWGWVTVPHQRAEQHSPFKLTTYWAAKGRIGRRRACAYLYATKITPQTRKRPIAVASAGFRKLA
jgi:hypothetical protein